jgi:hypothetical protein
MRAQASPHKALPKQRQATMERKGPSGMAQVTGQHADMASGVYQRGCRLGPVPSLLGPLHLPPTAQEGGSLAQCYCQDAKHLSPMNK